MELPADFRGVEVTVVLPVQLDCDVNGDPAFIELQAHDFISMEYGDHSWTRALPLNERDVKDGASVSARRHFADYQAPNLSCSFVGTANLYCGLLL